MIGLRQKSAHITMVEHLGAQCFESFWLFGFLSRTSDGWFLVFYGLPMHVICWRHMFLITQYTWFTLPHDFMYIVHMHCLSMHASTSVFAFFVTWVCQAKPKVWQQEDGHVAAFWKLQAPEDLLPLGTEGSKSLKFFWGGSYEGRFCEEVMLGMLYGIICGMFIDVFHMFHSIIDVFHVMFSIFLWCFIWEGLM